MKIRKDFTLVKYMGMPYADLHCDTLTCFQPPEKNFLHTKDKQISLEKLLGGDCILQCFAIFCPQNAPYGGEKNEADEAWERARAYASAFSAAKSEIETLGINPVLTVENGGFACGENLERIDDFAKAGVKMFGLIWNEENAWGYPCGMDAGLKKTGREALEKLFSLGVIADVSHLSDRGAEEAAEEAIKAGVPIAASHSLCRAVYPHKGNLTDGAIRKIASSGGVAGVNFVREFIGKRQIRNDEKRLKEMFFAHLKHLIKTGGEDVAAIGSDFDGTEHPLYASAEEMPKLFADMEKAGFSPRLIEKIAFKNVCRMLNIYKP